MAKILNGMSFKDLYELENSVLYDMRRAKDIATLSRLSAEQAAINEEVEAKRKRGETL